MNLIQYFINLLITSNFTWLKQKLILEEKKKIVDD